MLVAGMRPAICQRIALPQVITPNPATSPTSASASSQRRRPFQASSDATSAPPRIHHATRVGRVSL